MGVPLPTDTLALCMCVCVCVCVCVCAGIFSHNYTSRELTKQKEQIVYVKTHLFHNYIQEIDTIFTY